MNTRAPKTLFEAIEWCSGNLSIVRFLPTGTREKNSVALTFRHPNGIEESVGGYSLLHCVQKAHIKIAVQNP
jgi:hypothetical protein